ncbi:MAG: hypothetical protein M3R57_11620, partial [Chloroflexota bacterium]|nr:hypothetical protein [Chloroflexota bacterium]
MREIEDRALEALLTRTLAEHAEEIPFTLTPEIVRARLEDRRRRRGWVIPGRRIVLLGLAAVLLLPIALFVGGSLRPQEGPRVTGPNPAATALPAPATELPAPSAQVADRYQALVIRYEDKAAVIVAVRGDRQERVIASIPALERRFGDLVPSADGWLARVNGAASEFIDLRDPGRAPRPFSIGETTTGYSWNPDGRFAVWDESGLVTLIDPKTGAETPLTVRGPLYDVLGWTADGSALLARGAGGDAIYAGTERVTDPAWRVIRLDGGPDETTVPDLDLGLVRSARYGQRGARLQLCERGRGQSANGEPEHYDCPDELMGGVVGDIPGGTVTTWYGSELAPDHVDDASFGGDGTAMWLLLDRRVGGRQFALARIDTPGTARVVAASGLPAAGYDPFSIVAVAPDDSLLAINASDLVLVEPITGRSTAIDGRFLAFIASATADTWAGEAFRPVEPMASLDPVVPAYPTLPPIDEMAQLSAGDRELWRQEYVAVEGAAAAPTRTEIGPLEFKTGFGLGLVCSGPSDVRVTMEPASPFMPALGRCDSGEAVGGQIPSFAINASARFVVTANTDTSWQLVIFD